LNAPFIASSDYRLITVAIFIAIKDNNDNPFHIQAMIPRLAPDHVRHLHARQALTESLSCSDHHNQDRAVHSHASNV
jgi:hypothetical protein